MTEKISLIGKKRDEAAKNPQKLREEELVPGVVYGPKTKNIAVVFDKKQIATIEHGAEKAAIAALKIEGEDKERNVIIQELQHDKLTDELLHVDLYEVDMTKEIETEVPLTFTGTAIAVKDLGGVFLHNIDEVLVKCLPANLPAEIKVDISVLATFEDMIYVRDLKVPEGVEILAGEDELVAMVSEPRSEKEIEELDEEVADDVSKVEGVAEKEGEEEGEEKEKAEGGGEDKGDKPADGGDADKKAE